MLYIIGCLPVYTLVGVSGLVSQLFIVYIKSIQYIALYLLSTLQTQTNLASTGHYTKYLKPQNTVFIFKIRCLSIFSLLNIVLLKLPSAIEVMSNFSILLLDQLFYCKW